MVTKGNVKGHPTLCYKWSLITHCKGFWLAKLRQDYLRESLDNIVTSLGFSNVQSQYISLEDQAVMAVKFHYWNQWVHMDVLYDQNLHFLIKQSKHIFMHILLLQLDYSSCCSNVCCLSYVFVYELYCMQLYESFCRCVVGLNITLDCLLSFFPAGDASLLLCSLISQVLLQVSKGCTHLTPHVLEPFMHLPWLTTYVTSLLPTKLSYLPMCEIAVRELPYDPLLRLLHQMV